MPGLQLRKSTAAQSPAAPFPIIARAEVVAPPAAERYDVQTFTLACRLGSGVAAPGVAGGVLEAAVQVTVESPDLPAVLRQAMGAELHRLWAAAGPGAACPLYARLPRVQQRAAWFGAGAGAADHRPPPPHPRSPACPAVAGRLNLQLLWGTAPQQFVHLLSLVPAVLESYQSEDAWGGTVRRWAILSDAASVQFDAPAQQQQQQGGQAAAAEAAPAPAAVPKGLQSELDFLRKLYDLQLHQQHEAAAGEAAAADAVAERLTGLHLAPSAAGRVGAAATEAVLAFELSLRPRDPAWDPARPALVLHGWVQPGAYPAAGSLAVEASAAQRPLLPTLQLEVLNKLLAHEVAAAAGRPGALRAVARHADNHGGQLLAQAEDIASEVARRRRQLQEEQRGGTAAAAAAEGAQRGSSASELDGSGSSDGGYSSGGSYSSGSAESGSAASSGQEDASGKRHGGGGHSDAVLPLQLQLERLELVDCDVLELLRLNIQVSCARCRATGELSFATAAVALPSDGGGGGDGGSGGTLAAAADCPTCHQAWEVQVAPKLVHERSNVLSLLRSTGCAPIDLLPSMLAGQCGRCASSAAFRSVAVGRWNERACSACHTPMRFQVWQGAGRWCGIG